MEQQEKKGIFEMKNKMLPILLILISLILFTVNMSSKTEKTQTINNATTTTNNPIKSSFSSEARSRFDDILASSPELSSISCESDDCSYVVYFNYKTIPDDVEFVIRGNTATFSKLKQDKTGVSHVSIAARFNNNVFFACDGADGMVQKCQNYNK